MATVICVRCGAAGDRGAVSGMCTLCAPSAERAAQRTVDAGDLTIAVVRRAADDGEPVPAVTGALVSRRRERPKRPRRDDVRWLVSPDPRTVPHLFGQGTPDSCCGKVAHSPRLVIANRGRRGCRRCAYAAGLTASISEPVTT